MDEEPRSGAKSTILLYGLVPILILAGVIAFVVAATVLFPSIAPFRK